MLPNAKVYYIDTTSQVVHVATQPPWSNHIDYGVLQVLGEYSNRMDAVMSARWKGYSAAHMCEQCPRILKATIEVAKCPHNSWVVYIR